MPTTYLAPGVYVEEVPGGPRPIEAVGTSLAAFLGQAPALDAHVNEAIEINNLSQFDREFVRDQADTNLSYAVQGFFQNGGSRCYVVNVGDGDLTTGLQVLEQYDEVAIVAAPGYTDAAAYDAVLTHCEGLEDRVAVLDAPVEVSELSRLTEVAIVQPDAPGESTPGLRARASAYGTFYFPWIAVPVARGQPPVFVPPSGHVAGIWARTDALRGVHKAPANEIVRGAVGLKYQITRAQQGELNRAGVNCIRFFGREGIKVWGARTLAGDPAWRYLNVRRLFNMIKESIKEGTNWIVFEPNAYPLWEDIKRDITNFLTTLWRAGALMGRTAEEAFFVKCDEETNPPEERELGRVTTLIGAQPVYPAEFIIFRISQSRGGAEVETE